jgi:methyltransferase
MVTAYLVLLTLLGVERLHELSVSAKNAAWARQRGGIEVGQSHFRVMRLLHVAFFAGCVVEVLVLDRLFVPLLGLPALGLALAAQGLRAWAVATLGPRWNVRVIVLPGEPAITGGPYRWLRHPNYLAVIVEGLAVPLIHGAYLTAATFTVANAVLLAVRIRCEEAALRAHCAYGERFAGVSRFVPRTTGARS